MPDQNEFKAISEILTYCNMPVNKLKILQKNCTSSNKTLYLLENNKIKLWLKIYPEKRKFKQELATYHFLKNHQLNHTPELLGTVQTSSTIALLLSHCKGKTITDIPTEKTKINIFYKAGIFLKNLHQTKITDTDKISGFQAIQLRIKALEKQTKKLNLQNEYPNFFRQLNNIIPVLLNNKKLLTRSFCHRDFSPRNWLFNKDKDNLNIIDFEHSRKDITLLDLVKLHAHYFRENQQFQQAFYQGYKQTLLPANKEQTKNRKKSTTANCKIPPLTGQQISGNLNENFQETINALTCFYGLQTLAWATRYQNREFLNLAYQALK